MKSHLLAFSVLLFTVQADGQKAYENEIGIGIGSFEYTSSSGIKSITKKKIVFGEPKFIWMSIPFVWQGGGAEKVTKSYSLPSFYYSRVLGSRLSFVASYQYSYKKGILFDFMYGSEKDMGRTFNIKNHQIQFGYLYSFFKNKKANPYIGLGFDIDSYIAKYKFYYNSKELEEFHEEDGTFSPYLALGVSAKLYKRFSLKYDASLTTDFVKLYIRPINRLSINYQF